MDLTSDEVARPLLLDADAPARPAASWGGAVAVHVVAGLALAAIGLGSQPPASSPPTEVMTVTLVERPRPEPAAPSAPAAEQPTAEAFVEPTAPAEYAVDIAPAAPTLFAPPDYLRLDDPDAALAAPSDAVRQALAHSIRCSDRTEQLRVDCPSTSDYAALADASGLSPARFLDAELEPLPDGTFAFEVGPVAVSMTMYAPGSMPYVVTIKPRGRRAHD